MISVVLELKPKSDNNCSIPTESNKATASEREGIEPSEILYFTVVMSF
jgi:hypothetical protein